MLKTFQVCILVIMVLQSLALTAPASENGNCPVHKCVLCKEEKKQWLGLETIYQQNSDFRLKTEYCNIWKKRSLVLLDTYHIYGCVNAEICPIHEIISKKNTFAIKCPQTNIEQKAEEECKVNISQNLAKINCPELEIDCSAKMWGNDLFPTKGFICDVKLNSCFSSIKSDHKSIGPDITFCPSGSKSIKTKIRGSELHLCKWDTIKYISKLTSDVLSAPHTYIHAGNIREGVSAYELSYGENRYIFKTKEEAVKYHDQIEKIKAVQK